MNVPRLFTAVAALLTFAGAGDAVAQTAEAPRPERAGPMASTTMGPNKRVRPGPHVPMPAVRDPAAVVIRLDRGGCYGPCPSYSVEIRGSGEVRYQGSSYVVVTGNHRATVSPERVQALLKLFETNDYWSLRGKYEADVTDSAGYRLSVTIDGVTKTVNDYVGQAVGMPVAVTALEEAVDIASGADRWVLGTGDTLASLRAEGWDFRSPEAAETLARAAYEAPDALVFGLIDAGAPVTIAGALDSRYHYSALEHAALKARLELVRRLIALGAAPGPAERDAALFAAVASRHPDVVAEILKLGPNPNAVNEGGMTPLAWIEEGPHPFYFKPELTDPGAVVRLLIAAGADPLWRDADGDTLLHGVLTTEVARALIAAGVPLELRNKYGETPLLSLYSEDVALILIDAGADTNVRNSKGESVRDRARRSGWKRVLARLDAR